MDTSESKLALGTLIGVFRPLSGLATSFSKPEKATDETVLAG